jgi:hypothetical protein
MNKEKIFFIGVFVGVAITTLTFIITNSTDRTPEGCDKDLLETTNFFVEENVRLENYIKQLEEENQRLGSTLAQKEYEDE